MQSLLSFHSINHSRTKFYLANALTLGLYGAGYVMIQARVIGKRVGANLPGTGLSVLLTILTLGIYPCVIVHLVQQRTEMKPRQFCSSLLQKPSCSLGFAARTKAMQEALTELDNRLRIIAEARQQEFPK